MDYIQDFQRVLRTSGASERTIADYAAIVRRMSDYIRANYNAEFEKDDVKGFMVSNWATSIEDRKPSTRRLYHVVASKYLVFLYDLQYVSHDLSRALPKLPSLEKQYAIQPEARPDKRPYSNEEVRRMLECECGTYFETCRKNALVAALVTTGLRCSELLALTIADLIRPDNTAMIPRKGTHGNPVKVHIPPEILPVMLEYLKVRKIRVGDFSAGDPVFVSRSGAPLCRTDVYRILAKVEKSLGIPTGVHTFRHTALSEIARIADPATARDVAGQKSIEVTNRYLHSTDESMAAAVSGLASAFLAAK